ncbi:MAG: nucleotidyltransferase domain-containing protein [Candidatus Thermoplasmatota archaeon]|jgi:predicted nucleotidyltransferase|nr:nucleotidyltransferase domain-containing protein [Candidatus Thermoplasmatota archaeon]
MDRTTKRIVELVRAVVEPERIILFGSRVSGTHHEGSDYDLLVIIASEQGTREVLRKIYSSFKGIGAPVDLLVIDERKYDILRQNENTVFNEISNTGVTVYAKA